MELRYNTMYYYGLRTPNSVDGAYAICIYTKPRYFYSGQ